MFIESVNLRVEEAMQDNKIRLESEAANVFEVRRKGERVGRDRTTSLRNMHT